MLQKSCRKIRVSEAAALARGSRHQGWWGSKGDGPSCPTGHTAPSPLAYKSLQKLPEGGINTTVKALPGMKWTLSSALGEGGPSPPHRPAGISAGLRDPTVAVGRGPLPCWEGLRLHPRGGSGLGSPHTDAQPRLRSTPRVGSEAQVLLSHSPCVDLQVFFSLAR